MRSSVQSDISLYFIIELLMQHPYCCVNLVGIVEEYGKWTEQHPCITRYEESLLEARWVSDYHIRSFMEPPLKSRSQLKLPKRISQKVIFILEIKVHGSWNGYFFPTLLWGCETTISKRRLAYPNRGHSQFPRHFWTSYEYTSFIMKFKISCAH